MYGYRPLAVRSLTCHTATGTHMTYKITNEQCANIMPPAHRLDRRKQQK